MAARRAVLIALFVLSFPLNAGAQTSPDELRRNADAIASGERGLEAFRSGDWSAAYAAFQDAETAAHSPVFLLYMARIRERQGASAEALDLYARVTREPLAEDAPEAWRAAAEQAQSESAELRSRLRLSAAKPARQVPSSSNGATRSRASRNAALAAGSIGLASLALGAAAGIVAWIQLDQLKSRCGANGCKPQDKSSLENVETWSRLSDLGFAVAGAGLTASAVFLWVVPATPAAGTSAFNVGAAARLRF